AALRTCASGRGYGAAGRQPDQVLAHAGRIPSGTAARRRAHRTGAARVAEKIRRRDRALARGENSLARQLAHDRVKRVLRFETDARALGQLQVSVLDLRIVGEAGERTE